jgi:hypothetical protein
VNGIFRMPCKLVRIMAGKEATTIVNHLIGVRTGRSKEKCVDALLTGKAALPERAKIEFHQRLGYVEFADGVALFVNMPDRSFKRGYPNEWLGDGKFMTWYLRKNEWNDGTSSLARKLMLAGDGEVGDPPFVAILFVRMAKGVFLCCGRCRAIPTGSHQPENEVIDGVRKASDWGLFQLQLELLDRGKLKDSGDFIKMVCNWLGNGRDSDIESSNMSHNRGKTNQDLPGPRRGAKANEMHTLADVVLSGNIVGGMNLALKRRNVPLDERSIVMGMEILKQELAKDTDIESAKALALLEHGHGIDDSTL